MKAISHSSIVSALWDEIYQPVNDKMAFKYQCRKCGRKTLTKSVMEYHLRRYHNRLLTKEVRNG